MEFKDYYQILGVEKNASADEIKKAYRKLARKYHPDVSKEADAAQRMAEINEANTVLSDAEKRKAYDQLGAQAYAQGMGAGGHYQPPPNWDSDFSFSEGAGDFSGFRGGEEEGYSEFFEHLFGRAAHTRRARGASASGAASMRGEDQRATIELDLADLYQGAEHTITLQGHTLDAQGHLVPQQRTLHVKIPKGVHEGQMIRLAGQGGAGHGGAAAGDLLLQVRLRADSRWRTEGKDVYQRLRLAPWEVALGGSVRVEMPGGAMIDVNVPAGSGSGRKLRLKGRGIPAARPGDLYLEIELAVPGAVTDQQRDAWQALANAYPGFNPRLA